MTIVRGAIAFLVGSGHTARDFDLERVRANYETVKGILNVVADRHKINRNVFKAIAWVESEFNRNARNPQSGAAGLFQIMPFHWQKSSGFLFNKWGPNTWADPERNADAGAQILIFSGYGRLTLPRTLANYGGFVTVNPRPYVAKVEGRATTLFLLGD